MMEGRGGGVYLDKSPRGFLFASWRKIITKAPTCSKLGQLHTYIQFPTQVNKQVISKPANMSDKNTSTLQSYIDSASGAVQSAIGSITGNTSDQVGLLSPSFGYSAPYRAVSQLCSFFFFYCPLLRHTIFPLHS